MMRLSGLNENTVPPHPIKALYPGSHCAFFGVSAMVPLIQNSRALMIGPAVCLYNAKLQINLRSLTSDPRPDNLLLLLLTQEDIIFGAYDKIQQGVIEADRKYQPEVLFVVTTCVQEIIGEDLDAVIKETQSRVKARLLVIHTDNFSCEDASPGIERTYLALADLMQPLPVKAQTVNLLGLRAPEGRKSEPVRLLESKGIHIQNVIPAYSTPAEISRAPEASLNIVLEHYALPLARQMEADFGTPFIYAERAYTPDAVCTWYEKMAKALHIDLDSEILAMKNSVKDRIRALKTEFSGKTCIVGIQQGRFFDLVHLLVQLGMNPLAVYVNRIITDDPADIRALLDEGIDPFVLKSGDAVGSDRFLAEMKPDYFIGHGDRKTLARLDIQARTLMRAFYTPGFEGTRAALNLLRRPLAGSSILYEKEKYIHRRGGLSV